MQTNKTKVNMRVLLLILAVLTVTTANATPIEKDIAKCSAIKGDLARLKCFDQLAMENNLQGKQLQPTNIENKDKWHIQTQVNPVDDSKTVVIFITADSGKGKYGDDINLIIRCQSNKTEMYINWQSYLGRDASVLTRIGSNKAGTSSWSISTDIKSTFRSRPIGFIKEMMSANKLVAQVTPYGDNPITATFDTAGLSNVIKPLRETCSW